MCLIIDANVAPSFFCTNEPCYAPLKKAVISDGCCIHYGGKLRREYLKTHQAFKMLLALDRAGRAKSFPDAPIDQRTEELENARCCTSDDPHIIAIAQLTG